MFTGIIEEVGSVKTLQMEGHATILTINAKKILVDMKLGDSIAVNGICLTVTAYGKDYFTVDVMPETLLRTSLQGIKQGSSLNLERAMSMNGRFGGHIVSGHIDGIASIDKIRKDGNAIWYTLQADPMILRGIVEKGSVALDGVSLTVASVTETSFSVSVIPHTIQNTILSTKNRKDLVNVENDMIGKYIEKFLKKSESEAKREIITHEFISTYGF